MHRTIRLGALSGAAGVVLLAAHACGSDPSSPSNNPVPTISGLRPDTALAGSSSASITVTGTGFVSGSTVSWNGTPRTTSDSTSTDLTVDLTGTDLAEPGVGLLTVQNPAPGGGASAPDSLVLAAPPPIITSIIRDTATAGLDSIDISAIGSSFFTSSHVTWNGTALMSTRISSVQLRATVPGSLLIAPSTVLVAVSTMHPGGGVSASVVFNILAAPPIPTLDSITPDSALSGSSNTLITLWGKHISLGSKVRWNGALRIATVVDSTRMTVYASSTDLADSGTATLSVFKSGPGGGASGPLAFHILYDPPTPVVLGLQNDTIWPDSTVAVFRVRGAAFRRSDAVVWDSTQIPTTYRSDTLLQVVVPYGSMSTSSPDTIAVIDTGVRGKRSGAHAELLLAPAPVFDSVTPDTVPPGFDTARVVIFGRDLLPTTGRLQGLLIWVGNRALVPTWTSGRQIAVAIPSTTIQHPGANAFMGVQGPTAAATGQLWLAYGHPIIDSVTPSIITDWGAGVTVWGDSISGGTTATVDGLVGQPVNFISTKFATLFITPEEVSGHDSAIVGFHNPHPGGGDAYHTIQVVSNPELDSMVIPSIIHPAPDSLTVGLLGNHLKLGSTATWGRWAGSAGTPTAVPLIVIDSTHGQVRLPPVALQSGTAIGIRVSNPSPLPGGSGYAVAEVWDSGVRSLRSVSVPGALLAADTARHIVYTAEFGPSPGDGPAPTLVAIDADSGMIVRTLPLGSEIPTDLKITPDGRYAWIALRYASKVVRVDLDLWTVDTSITMESDGAAAPHLWVPIRVAILPDGGLVIVRQSISNAGLPVSVAVFDGSTRRSKTFTFHPTGDPEVLPIAGSDSVIVLFGAGPRYFVLDATPIGLDSVGSTVWPAADMTGLGVSIGGDWLADGAAGGIDWRTGVIAGGTLPLATLLDADGTVVLSFDATLSDEWPPTTLTRRGSPGGAVLATRKWPARGVGQGTGDPSDAVRWSDDGLAYRIGAFVWIVRVDVAQR